METLRRGLLSPTLEHAPGLAPPWADSCLCTSKHCTQQEHHQCLCVKEGAAALSPRQLGRIHLIEATGSACPGPASPALDKH